MSSPLFWNPQSIAYTYLNLVLELRGTVHSHEVLVWNTHGGLRTGITQSVTQFSEFLKVEKALGSGGDAAEEGRGEERKGEESRGGKERRGKEGRGGEGTGGEGREGTLHLQRGIVDVSEIPAFLMQSNKGTEGRQIPPVGGGGVRQECHLGFQMEMLLGATRNLPRDHVSSRSKGSYGGRRNRNFH